MTDFVKTHPDLSVKALRARKDRELAIWYICRHLSDNGWLPISELHRFMVDNGLLVWGSKPMSEDRLKRYLRRGEGLFWHTAGDVLYYHSLRRVCEALGVSPYRRPKAVPLDAFRRLGVLRAFLYGSWIGEDKEISKATLTKLTGVTRMTINRWDHIVGTKKRRNLGIARFKTHKAAMVMLNWLNQVGKSGKPKLSRAFMWKDGKTVLIHMVSTLSVLLEELPRGQTVKVVDALQGVFSTALISDDSIPTLSGKRRYFDDLKAQRRAKKQGKLDSEFFVDTGQDWHDYRLWEYAQV